MAGISPSGFSSNAGFAASSQAATQTAAPAAGAAQPPSDQMKNTLDQVAANMKEKPKNLAGSYLKNTGLFQPRPLEKQVSVKPPDDSDYYAALGYTA